MKDVKDVSITNIYIVRGTITDEGRVSSSPDSRTLIAECGNSGEAGFYYYAFLTFKYRDEKISDFNTKLVSLSDLEAIINDENLNLRVVEDLDKNRFKEYFVQIMQAQELLKSKIEKKLI